MLGSPRRTWFTLVRVATLAALLVLAAPVSAQTCHLSDLSSNIAARFRVRALASFATYRNPVYAGEYQGYGGSVAYSHPWVGAEAAVMGYRIVRNGLREYGVGDLLLAARATAYRFDDTAALGVALAASLPTGDARRGLGMGHTMLMPGAWFTLHSGTLSLSIELAYGRLVGAEGHEHGAMGGALVNPMNRSEVENALAVSYVFWRTLYVAARFYGAVPVADAEGKARQAGALVLGASVSRFELGFEQHLPLVGDPFVSKTLLRLAVAL
jgi:hypothetical protein